MSQVRKGEVTLKGEGIDLIGPKLKVGDAAPDFTCANGMKSVLTQAETKGKVRIFSVVPSLDTPVCSIQTKKFAEALNDMADKVDAYTVSMDLPFAMNRFTGEAQITSLKNLSDTHDHSFGNNYGVLIQGLAMPLLARSIFVVDEGNTIRHIEIVPEIAQEPNYESALTALRASIAE